MNQIIDNSKDLEYRGRIDAALRGLTAAVKELSAAMEAARKAGMATQFSDGFYHPKWNKEDWHYQHTGRPHICLDLPTPFSVLLLRYY